MIDMYQALQSMQSKAEGAASYALHRFLEAESHGTESACIFNVTSRSRGLRRLFRPQRAFPT